MIRFQTNDEALLFALGEAMKELPERERPDASVSFVKIEKGLWVKGSADSYEIGYESIPAMLRAFGMLMGHVGEKLDICETPAFDTLGLMPDVSRNAVMKVESVKQLARIAAMEGFNAMMLYTEDTYEMKEYPYFGHLRGRYTAEELREVDDYCYALGIELIPCIQTLAHLNAIFEWPAFDKYRDCNDILCAEEPIVYEMIECMLRTMRQNLRSHRINLGLDEAHMLGVGKYLDKNGYHKRSDIMLRHIQKITELCKKYDYEPRMWSDMFFRMQNNGEYRVPGTVIDPKVVECVPPEMTLVYWDYHYPEKEHYDEMFRQHEGFHNPIAFAGGDNSWFGLVPLTWLALTATCSALASAREHKVREVYCTMWKDDGAACSFFSSMSTLFLYGEMCWNGCTAPEHMDDRMQSVVGLSYYDMVSIEDIDWVPRRIHVGTVEANPNKYLFYENIMMGKFSYHFSHKHTGPHYGKQALAVRAKAERAGKYAYIFDTLAALCDVLELKCDASYQLYDAYHAADRETMRRICEETIDQIMARVRVFRKAFRTQWMKENRPFGFDVMDIRIGGVLAQLDTAKYRLAAYLNGEVDRLEELEAERLPYIFDGNGPEDEKILRINRWERMAAQNISNMY